MEQNPKTMLSDKDILQVECKKCHTIIKRDVKKDTKCKCKSISVKNNDDRLLIKFPKGKDPNDYIIFTFADGTVGDLSTKGVSPATRTKFISYGKPKPSKRAAKATLLNETIAEAKISEV